MTTRQIPVPDNRHVTSMAFAEKRFSRILFRSVARVLMIGQGKVTWRSSLDGLNCLYLGTVQYLGEIRAT